MKKILGIMALTIAVMFSFAACNNNNNKVENNNQEENNSIVENNNQENENSNQTVIEEDSGEVITEPTNPTFNVAEALNSVSSISGLNESTKMSEAEVGKNFNFGKYDGLQKEIRSSITEDSIEEIVIIKIGENEQSMPLFQIIQGRMMSLKEQYKDNEKISAILDNGDNFVLKQQGGIFISIISEKAKEIETKLQESF